MGWATVKWSIGIPLAFLLKRDVVDWKLAPKSLEKRFVLDSEVKVKYFLSFLKASFFPNRPLSVRPNAV